MHFFGVGQLVLVDTDSSIETLTGMELYGPGPGGSSLASADLPKIRAPTDRDAPEAIWDFICLEYMDGGSLSAMLAKYEKASGKAKPGLQPGSKKAKKAKKWPWRERLRVLRDVAEGMAQMHARRYVHRDLKPDNVLLEASTGRCKVADLGLSRRDKLFQLSAAGKRPGDGSEEQPERIAWSACGGTPQYMSPDCIREWKQSLKEDAEAEAAEDGARDRGHSMDSTGPRKFHRHTWLTSAQVNFDDEEGGGGTGGGKSKETSTPQLRKINTWHGPDAYAFGIIMWEVMTLQPVWEGLGTEAMWSRVLDGRRPNVDSEHASTVPARYLELMREQWAADPEERPSFAETYKRLNRLCRRAGADTPPRAPKLKKRNVPQDLAMAAAFLRQTHAGESSLPVGNPGGGGLWEDDEEDQDQRTLFSKKKNLIPIKASTLKSVASAAAAAAPALFDDEKDFEAVLVAASKSPQASHGTSDGRERGDSLLSTASTLSQATMEPMGGGGDVASDNGATLIASAERKKMLADRV